jgi:putative NIF3 family GTP cyclohydrolase 1 type 2
MAWCTGGAQGYFEQAIAQGWIASCRGGLGADDPSGPGVGVAYLAIGHHASERYGVQALGAHLAGVRVEAEFVEVDNPV